MGSMKQNGLCLANCRRKIPVTMKSLLVNIPLGHMANDWAPGALWIITPAIGASLGLSPSEIGLLITIHYIGAAMGYFPAGLLADRVSNQGRLLTITFFWVGLGYLLASQAPGFWSLAILLAIAGMGDAAWHPIATGVLVETMPDRRGMVLGIHAMGGTLAEVGAPLLAGFLLGFMGWQQALQISAIPALVMGVVFLFFARKIPPSPAEAISRFELGRIARHWLRPLGIALTIKIAAYNMALMALMSMTPLFLQRELDYNPASAGLVFAMAMLLGSLLQPVVGRYSDGRDRQLVFIGGSLIAVVFSITAFAASPGALVVGSLIVAMAVLVSVRSSILASAVEYASTRAATTLGFVFVLLDGVGALGALMAGYLGEFDLQYAFGFAAGLSGLSIAISILIQRTGLTKAGAMQTQ